MDERPRLTWIGSIVLLVLATAALVAVLVATSSRREIAVRVYVILVEVVGARLLVRALLRATWVPRPLPFDLAVQPDASRAPASASELGNIAQELGASTSRVMEPHYRLRRLRTIAADRLAARHRVLLDEDIQRARALLGEEAWELLAPDRQPPEERFGPGLPIDRLARIVDAVEAL
jgi:hypothetical protein